MVFFDSPALPALRRKREARTSFAAVSELPTSGKNTPLRRSSMVFFDSPALPALRRKKRSRTSFAAVFDESLLSVGDSALLLFWVLLQAGWKHRGEKHVFLTCHYL